MRRKGFSGNRLGAMCYVPNPDVDKQGRIIHSVSRDTIYDTGKRVDTYIEYYGDTNKVKKSVSINRGNDVRKVIRHEDYEDLHDDNNKASVRITSQNFTNICKMEYLNKDGKVDKYIGFDPDNGITHIIDYVNKTNEYIHEPIYYMGKPAIPDPVPAVYKRKLSV